MLDFIALDVETTGLDFDAESMIELAAVRFVAGKAAAEFQAFFAPPKALTAMARLLTGLREEELSAAPPIADSLRAFLDFAGELPLVAHNAEFDATFVRRALEQVGLPALPGAWVDSLLIARTAWPTWENHRLESLATRLNFPPETSHRALPDARRAGLLFLEAQRVLRSAVSAQTWETLKALAADLPGWKSIFTGDIGDEKADSPHPPPVVDEATLLLPIATEKNAGENSAVEMLAASLGRDGWLALETDPGSDDLWVALRAAKRCAQGGARVLLAVPDFTAWNSIRNKLWPMLALAPAEASPGKTIRMVALGEPQGYLCRERLQAVLAEPGRRISPDERYPALPLAAWAASTASSLVADCRGFSPDRARLLWSRVACDRYDEDASALAARREADSADIVLVTHAALNTHLRLEGALLPVCDAVLVSGAHRLLETAPRACGREVSFFRLRQILQLLRQSPEQACGAWPELDPDRLASWFELEKHFQRFLQKIGRQAAKRRLPGETKIRYVEPLATSFEVNPEPLLTALKDQENFLANLRHDPGIALSTVRELDRIGARLRAFRMDFEPLCEARDAEQTYWVEDFSNPHKAVLRGQPRDLGPDFGQRLRAWFRAGACISPALALTGTEGRFFLRSLGLKDSEAGERVLVRRVFAAQPETLLLAPFAPAASVETAPNLARFLAEAVTPFSPDGVVVYFPSQGALRNVHAALQALLPAGSPLWAQHVDGNREALTRLYASAEGGLVLVTEGMEGLRDGRGRSPALILVARMPLPSFKEPVWDAEAERLREAGKNPRFELWHPLGVLRLKRELAPLRKTGPRVLWFLDARSIGDGLGAFAGRALGCEPVTVPDLDALQASTRAALSIL